MCGDVCVERRARRASAEDQHATTSRTDGSGGGSSGAEQRDARMRDNIKETKERERENGRTGRRREKRTGHGDERSGRRRLEEGAGTDDGGWERKGRTREGLERRER
jgi:hypothetical protein